MMSGLGNNDVAIGTLDIEGEVKAVAEQISLIEQEMDKKRNRSIESNTSEIESKRQAPNEQEWVHPSRLKPPSTGDPLPHPSTPNVLTPNPSQPGFNVPVQVGPPSGSSSPVKKQVSVIPPFTGTPPPYSIPLQKNQRHPFKPLPKLLRSPPDSPSRGPQVKTPTPVPEVTTSAPVQEVPTPAPSPVVTRLTLSPGPLIQELDSETLLNKFYAGISKQLDTRDANLLTKIDQSMDRRDEAMKQLIRSLTNQIELIQQEIVVMKSDIKQGDTELRQLIADQGERIRLLESRPTSTREGQVSSNSSGNIPAEYTEIYLSEEEQKNLVDHIMDMRRKGEFKAEGGGPEELRREVATMGAPYGYGPEWNRAEHSGSQLRPWAQALNKKVSEEEGEDFNQWSLTYYPAGSKMPKHGDDEKRLAHCSKIVGISLLTAWEMSFYHARRATEVGRVTLAPGSKIVMLQEDQTTYHHAILPCYDGPRISISIRRMKVEKEVKIALIGDSLVSRVIVGRNEKKGFEGTLGPSLPGTNIFAALGETLPAPSSLDRDTTDIVVAVGVNNLKKLNAHNTPELLLQRMKEYHSQISKTCPSANIMIQEVLPVRADQPALNSAIRQYNSLLSGHFSKGKVTLISSRVFMKKDGSLRDELIDQSDAKAPGIHLNAEGTALVAGRLKFALKKVNNILPPLPAQPRRTRPPYRRN